MLNEFLLRRRSRLRAYRNTLLSAMGMAAIVLGLLAMHSAGAERVNVAEISGATDHTHDEASGVDSTTVGAGVGAAVRCDAECMQGVLDCALMVVGCAMLLTIAALVLLAHRPGLFRALLDAGGRVVMVMRRAAPPHAFRPDLIVLSISRT